MRFALFLIPMLAYGQALHITGAHTSPTYSVATSGSLPTTGCSVGEIAVVGPATSSPVFYVNSTTGSCTWNIASGSIAPCSIVSGGLSCPGAFEVTGLGQPASGVGVPSLNESTLFYDSSNSYHLSRKDSSGVVHDLEGGGAANVSTGYWPFGYPAIPDSQAPVSVTSANYGNSGLFTAQSTIITHINYAVHTAASSGAGMLIGVFANVGGVPSGSPICSTVASGGAVTTTGAQSVVLPCTGLVIGTSYFLVETSADTTLQLQCGDYPSGYTSGFTIMSTSSAAFAGYTPAMSSGTGASLTFTSASGWSFIASTNPVLPTVFIW